MSSIDNRLNTQLPNGLESLDRQQAQFERALADPTLAELDASGQFRGPAVDAGEDVLNAQAWGEGERLFASDGLQGQLAGVDRGEAVEHGVDGVLAGIG